MNNLSELEQLYSDATVELINSYSPSERDGLVKGAYSICPFVTQVGKNYENSKHRMMFIGKATNGWLLELPYDGSTQSIVDFYRDVAFNLNCDERILHRGDEMQWVENLAGNSKGYNTNKSQFWNVIKKTTQSLEERQNWSSWIAWSNLYKFAPQGGNPSGKLKVNQEEYCWKILDEEIDILKPKCIIFLTSGWENKYLLHRYGTLPPESHTSFGRDKKYGISYFTDKNILFVLSQHPMGKPIKAHADKLHEIVSNSLQ